MPDEGSPYTLFNDPESIHSKAIQLVDLVQDGLAGATSVPFSKATMWKSLLGPGLLAKASGTLESMMLLLPSRRSADAMILLRALFENAVILAWIAADPATRADAWYRTSAFRELREHQDWLKAGLDLKTSAEAKQLKIEAGSESHRLPAVPVMAYEADQHWGNVVPGWTRDSTVKDNPNVFSSLRGLYRYVYQRGSAATHSGARGLDPFLDDDPNVLSVTAEKPSDDFKAYALGLYSLSFAIMAAESSLGWPSWRDAARILERETALFPD